MLAGVSCQLLLFYFSKAKMFLNYWCFKLSFYHNQFLADSRTVMVLFRSNSVVKILSCHLASYSLIMFSCKKWTSAYAPGIVRHRQAEKLWLCMLQYFYFKKIKHLWNPDPFFLLDRCKQSMFRKGWSQKAVDDGEWFGMKVSQFQAGSLELGVLYSSLLRAPAGPRSCWPYL